MTPIVSFILSHWYVVFIGMGLSFPVAYLSYHHRSWLWVIPFILCYLPMTIYVYAQVQSLMYLGNPYYALLSILPPFLLITVTVGFLAQMGYISKKTSQEPGKTK